MPGAVFCETGDGLYSGGDDEALADVCALGMDIKGFEFGTLGMNRPVPVRMRRQF